jgi:hypothetical protein
MSKYGDYRAIKTSEGVLKAGESLSQHDLVFINTTPTPDTIDQTTGNQVEAIGVVFDEYDEGDEVAVKLVGPVTMRASEEIEVGDKLIPAADGKVAVDDGTASDIVIGVAETYASGDGALFEGNLAAHKIANA